MARICRLCQEQWVKVQLWFDYFVLLEFLNFHELSVFPLLRYSGISGPSNWTHTHTRTASSYCRLVTWEQRFPPTLKGNDLCRRVPRPSTLRLPSLWGISDYVFCQCVCGNLLICTNTDSNAPAIAGFLADGWLGCRLMAESVGPQLGAGNIAHYTFSRRGKANSHGCAACRCRCNHIILNHRSVTHRQSLGSCQRAGWSLIKARPKTKWHVLNLIRGDVKQTITYPSRCEAHPPRPSALNEFSSSSFPFFCKLELSSQGAPCIFYEGIMADGGWLPAWAFPSLIRHCPLDLIRRWPPLFLTRKYLL